VRYSISSTLDDFDYFRRPVWVTSCARVRAGTPSGGAGWPISSAWPCELHAARYCHGRRDGKVDGTCRAPPLSPARCRLPLRPTPSKRLLPWPGLWSKASSALTDSISPGTTSLIPPA